MMIKEFGNKYKNYMKKTVYLLERLLIINIMDDINLLNKNIAEDSISEGYAIQIK